MSIETFARETRMPADDADAFVRNFYGTFPIMARYLEDIRHRLADTGCVQSVYGRQLHFDVSRLNSSEMIKARVSAQK